MQRLIVITGDLAAGKSTLAMALSEHYQIPFITKDALKEIACDIIGYSSREENRELSSVATSEMIYFFKQCALVGQDLILEANFRTDELKELLPVPVIEYDGNKYKRTYNLKNSIGKVRSFYGNCGVLVSFSCTGGLAAFASVFDWRNSFNIWSYSFFDGRGYWNSAYWRKNWSGSGEQAKPFFASGSFFCNRISCDGGRT